MKKFIIKLSLFFAIMFVVDRACGVFFNYLVNHAKGGYVGHHQFMNNSCDQDLLVFGSSRAIHHYNTKILSDSLGMTCYNCGQDGSGIIFFYGQWKLINQRYKPKYVIYDIIPEFDLSKNDNHKYIGWLKLYYDKPGIPELINDVDSTEQIKMLSHMYQYNYNPMQIIVDYIKPYHAIDKYGFNPIKRDLDTMQIKKTGLSRPQHYSFDSLKLEYFNKLLDYNTQTQFIFVFSPIWYGADERKIQPIRDLCKQKNVKFVDFSNNPKYVHHNEFFADGSHLNARGADEFTVDLFHQLQDLGIIEMDKHPGKDNYCYQ